MKKILFLTRSYPNTRRSATRLCTHRVIECVRLSNHYDVHVLCVQYQDEPIEELIGGVHVHRFHPSCWVWLRQKIQLSPRYSRCDRLFEIVHKIISVPYYPLLEPLTAKYYYRAARKLQETINFDLIISEHHDLESLITGCHLMKAFDDLKHVAILWDPLKGQMPTVYLPKSYTNKRIGKIEEYAAKNTTLQISMNSMRQYFNSMGDIASDHRIFLDIPGVMKPEQEVDTKYLKLFRTGSINFVFSGLLSSTQRDPRPIIRLLNHTDFAERLNLLFFTMGANDIMKEMMKDFKGTIVFHDYIPLSELHTLYLHADYLLNVSHINPNMVPSKIFEYMSYGKPIISTYVTEGDSAQKYICRYPEGLCLDLKRPEIENVNRLNYFFCQVHHPVTFDEVKKEFKENTPEKYLELIDKII